jgi:hypothetical protein
MQKYIAATDRSLPCSVKNGFHRETKRSHQMFDIAFKVLYNTNTSPLFLRGQGARRLKAASASLITYKQIWLYRTGEDENLRLCGWF